MLALKKSVCFHLSRVPNKQTKKTLRNAKQTFLREHFEEVKRGVENCKT